MTLDYVLITPARNEAAYLEMTMRSVIAQTVLPKRWIIVDDGSEDDTGEIARCLGEERPWIELVRLPVRRDRSFAGKAQAFDAGYERVRSLSFDIIGCLDADITFVDDYFSFLLQQFVSDPKLGVAGTHYVEGDFHSFNDSYIDVRHVNGGCQLFRRACFDDVGGYIPIRGGGIDWVAVTTARMKGWTTHSYAERTFQHHRKIGTAESNELASLFNYGKKDHFLGGHPLWELFRGAYQMTKKPYLVGGVTLIAGYLWSCVTLPARPISKELVKFHQDEQLERLKQLISRRLRVERGNES